MHQPLSPFAVLLAIPTTRNEYMAAASRQPSSDYMQHTLAGSTAEQVWSERYDRIADAASALVHSLQSQGVPTITQASLNDLCDAAARAQTVVVFAHWARLPGTNALTGRPNGALELSDGLADVHKLDAALPMGFSGTLDLCCCHSVVPAAHLKLRRGDALRVVHGSEALDPLPALVIVRHLIELALRTGSDYRHARLQAAAGLARPS